jgi:uncharacterized protein (TIGR00369 family)
VLLGARLVAFGHGEATLELDIREELRRQYGFVHGGVLGYAADNALTFAAGSVAGNGLITSGFTIHYLRPATGEILHAHARVIRAWAHSCRLPLRPVHRRRLGHGEAVRGGPGHDRRDRRRRHGRRHLRLRASPDGQRVNTGEYGRIREDPEESG